MASELLKNKFNSTSAKVDRILERAIKKAENLPNCTPEKIWEEFEAVWNKISSQTQAEQGLMKLG